MGVDCVELGKLYLVVDGAESRSFGLYEEMTDYAGHFKYVREYPADVSFMIYEVIKKFRNGYERLRICGAGGMGTIDVALHNLKVFGT